MKYLLLLAMISPMCAFAQARFSRLYDYNDNDSQTGFTILEQSAQGYLVGMKNTGAEYSDNKILLFRLDELGNELWIKEIYTEGFIYYLDYGSMLRLPDGNYLLGGYIKELSTDLRDAFLIRTDTFGNVLWEKTYGVSDKNDFFGNFALTPDSTHIVFCGQTRRTDAAGNIWLVKTDLDGEVVWDKEIPQAGWQNGKYMAMLADGSFLLASHYDTADKNQYKVYKFDASGYAVWQKKVGTNHDDSGYPKVVALPDGSGLFTGSVGTADWRVHLAYAVKLSPSGAIVWEKTYHTGFSTSAFAKPMVLEDGSAVLSGGIDYDTFSSPRYVRFWKINLQGEMLWEQVHSNNPNGSNYIYHQIGTSDGGFAGVGFSHAPGATFQDAWVLKLDSEGCLVENCTVSAGEPEGEKSEINIYPNPAQDIIQIQSPNSPLESIHVFDATGRWVQEIPVQNGSTNVTLDVSGYVPGLYFLRIRTATGEVVTRALAVVR